MSYSTNYWDLYVIVFFCVCRLYRGRPSGSEERGEESHVAIAVQLNQELQHRGSLLIL